jgi:hypothetical protein
MTEEELKKVRFNVWHISTKSEGITSYISTDGRLGIIDSVPLDQDGYVKKKGRAIRLYRIDGKVYKSKKKFLEALKDFNS